MTDERTQERLRRKAQRQQERRDQILDAAMEMLGQGKKLTMTAVAKKASVTTSALYHYFDKIEALSDALAIKLVAVDVEIQMNAASGEADIVEALCALMHARVAYFLENANAFTVLYQGLVGNGVSLETLQGQIYPLSARVNGYLEERLIKAVAAGTVNPEVHPRKLANLAYYISNGILTTALSMSRAGGSLLFQPEELCAEAAATLRRACKP